MHVRTLAALLAANFCGTEKDYSPYIGILTSLGFIVGTLFVTTIASLIKSSYDRRQVEVEVRIDD